MAFNVKFFTKWTQSLTAKTSLAGTEEIVITDAGAAKKVLASTLVSETGMVPHAQTHAIGGSDVLTPAAIGAIPVDGGVIQRYNETGGVLVPIAGKLTIRLNGLIYAVNVANPITEIVVQIEEYSALGSVIVYFFQASEGGMDVTYPLDWYWDSGETLAVDTTARAISRLVLMADHLGNIHADMSYRRQVAEASSS